MSDVTSLIADMEKATRPRRELDADLHEAFGLGSVIPLYTSSIDAALTLIQTGFFLDLHDWTWSEEQAWCASLQTVQGDRKHISEKGATAPIAICLAALRARATT